MGPWFPNQGSNLSPQQWKHGVNIYIHGDCIEEEVRIGSVTTNITINQEARSMTEAEINAPSKSL